MNTPEFVAKWKSSTPTSLYNERSNWLRNLYAHLDRAVWDAYGCRRMKSPRTCRKK